MDFKQLPSQVWKGTKNIVAPVGKFYLAHQSTILMTTQIGLSIATPIVVIKNANTITSTIADAKLYLDEAKTVDEKNNIYAATLKQLAPAVVPIVAMEALQIYIAVLNKRAIDSKDKTIAELTDSLAVANNAIVSYQAFKREAEARMTDKKLEEVKDAVAKEAIEKNPETDKNTTIKKSAVMAKDTTANDIYKYWDVYGQRYFYSTKAPSDIKIMIADLSIAMSKGEWNNYDSYGRNTCTLNDIYERIAPELVMHPAGDVYGWYDDDRVGKIGKVSEDLINYDIRAVEDPNHADQTVWQFDLEGAPLFHDRY